MEGGETPPWSSRLVLDQGQKCVDSSIRGVNLLALSEQIFQLKLFYLGWRQCVTVSLLWSICHRLREVRFILERFGILVSNQTWERKVRGAADAFHVAVDHFHCIVQKYLNNFITWCLLLCVHSPHSAHPQHVRSCSLTDPPSLHQLSKSAIELLKKHKLHLMWFVCLLLSPLSCISLEVY